jgi:acetyl-CoA carboxylase biotin carboxyl carrier protein
MDLNYLRRLVKVFDDSTLDSLVIEEEGVKIKFNRSKTTFADSHSTIQQYVSSASQVLPASAVENPLYESPKVQVSVTAPIAEATDLHTITSPIVGTFYRSPSPDSDAFVDVGVHITNGKVLCIVEAMKLMNQIESEVSGKIEKILVENGNPVEYGQPLFLVKLD